MEDLDDQESTKDVLGLDCRKVTEQHEGDLSGVGQQAHLTIAFLLALLMSVLYFQEASV